MNVNSQWPVVIGPGDRMWRQIQRWSDRFPRIDVTIEPDLGNVTVWNTWDDEDDDKRSFAVMYDLDVETGVWFHWHAQNSPANRE